LKSKSHKGYQADVARPKDKRGLRRQPTTSEGGWAGRKNTVSFYSRMEKETKRRATQAAAKRNYGGNKLLQSKRSNQEEASNKGIYRTSAPNDGAALITVEAQKRGSV